MVKKRREVKEFKYPVESGPLKALVDMFKPIPVLLLFHVSMALLLVTGLVMDLLGRWIGVYSLQVFHGYVGTFFAIMFVVYVGIIVINKDFRALREPINYVEMVFYAALILFGMAIKFPALLPFLGPISPFHCSLLTYGWVVVSVLGGGGIVQGLASMYFIFARARSKIHSFQVPKEVKED